jgi:hypothetical protein
LVKHATKAPVYYAPLGREPGVLSLHADNVLDCTAAKLPGWDTEEATLGRDEYKIEIVSRSESSTSTEKK